MSSMSKATSDDAKVDLEKGLKAAATEEESELAVVNPRIATCIKTTLNAMVTFHTLSLIVITALMVKVSDYWWEPWPVVLFFAVLLVWAFWMTPKVKDGLVKKYATKHTPASDSDVTTKLLASEK